MSVAVEKLQVPTGTPMGGYGWGVDRRANGLVANPLKIRCVIIEPSSGPRIAIAQVDVISIPRPVYQEILRRVLDAKVVTSAACFVLAQTHTHSGPMVGDKPDPYVLLDSENAAEVTKKYTQDFINYVVNTILIAHATQRTSVTLGYAEGYAEIGANRCGLSWAPREVPVLVARRTDNYDLFAVLAGHTCHPVCGPHMGLTLDADYCGFAADEVEKRLGPGVPVIFFQGAAGDINPTGADQGPALVTLAALKLTNAIVAAVRNAAYFPLSGPVSVGIETVQLKYSVDLRDPAEVAELRGKYEKRVAAGGEGGGSGEGDVAAGVRHAAKMLEELKGSPANSMPMTIQKLDLGGLTILTMSHEVLSGWQVGTKNHWSGNRSTPLWVMGYANHIDCYVPAYDILSLGQHNEAGWSDNDPKMIGIGTYGHSYSLIAPLNAGANVQDPDGVEATLVPRINALLGLPAQ